MNRIAMVGLAVVALAVTVRAESDAGQADFVPWSGPWWQHATGGLTQPLAKYDQYAGTTAEDWERQNHVDREAEQWFGHCHAWSASAVMEPEPREKRSLGEVDFGTGDLKGILAACHGNDIVASFGERCFEEEDDRSDMKPDLVLEVLQRYVKSHRLPIIMDLDAGPQVWNYPVYAYEVQWEPSGDGTAEGTLRILAADDNVLPGYLGTQKLTRKYTFRLTMADGAVVAGSGEWTGTSVDDHPDFAWYPQVAVADNPEVHHDKAAEILGHPVGGGPGEPEPTEPTPPTEPPPPEEPEPADPPEPEVPPTPGDLREILDPYELVALVANQTSDFEFDLTVDKFDGGLYAAGESIRATVQSAETGYLYLFDLSGEGQIRLVFPQPGQPNRIEAKTTYDIPAQGDQATWACDSPGAHQLRGIVVSKPIRMTGFVQGVPAPTQAPRQADGGAHKGMPWRLQEMVVPPTTAERVQKEVFRVMGASPRQGEPGQQQDEPPTQEPTGKQRPFDDAAFAQDQCVYVVLESRSPAQKEEKPSPGRQQGKN